MTKKSAGAVCSNAPKRILTLTVWFPGTIAVLASACLALPQKKPGRSIGALEVNQEVRIVFESQGCFNHQTFTLELNGKSLDQILVSGPDRKAMVSITDKDRTELDKSLDFYRSNPGGECTTTDSITLTWLKFGVPIKKESFEDSTCSQDFLRKLIDKAVPGPSINPKNSDR